MVATGDAPRKAIDTIAKRFKTSKYNAGRVVMTESAYFSSVAQKDCFNELGVEQYKIIGTLDSSTCETCGDMDGRIFKMSEYKEGTTAPPFHPWCRCCTAPYFADMEGVGVRYSRDAVSDERYKLPKDTTYKEWKAKQDATHGKGTIDKEQKMSYNFNADSVQYERYTEILGSHAPKTFADFQAIKYSDDWQPFKAYSRAVKSGELTALADFDLYKSTGLQIDTNIVGKNASNGLLISGKSYHYIARTIGSISQKRNGVSVDDALDTLLHPSKVEDVKINANGKSQRFISDKAAVTINPDTCVLIQTNPLRTKKGAK